MECYQCGEALELEERVTRKDECPACHAFVRCCRNCRFHDPGAHNQCREPAAEWVSNHEAANFCEYFEPGGGGGGRRDAGNARDEFDRLFKS